MGFIFFIFIMYIAFHVVLMGLSVVLKNHERNMVKAPVRSHHGVVHRQVQHHSENW